jgi:NUMOD3 motif
MFYTYAHYTPEGRLFYIGKGKRDRAYAKIGRNTHWHNVVNKYGKPDVQILANWDTEKEALDHERILISCFRDLGYKLCNLSDGGRGNSGIEMTEETKLKISLSKKGTPAWNKGIPLTEDCKQKLSQSLSGRKAWNKGVECRPETKQKLQKAGLGNKYALGHKVSEVSKKLMGLANLGRPSSAKQKAIASAISKGNKHATGNTAQRKWVWVGTNIKTGEVVKFIGEQAMKEAGIQHANVIKCISGHRKSHKGYTWHREPWENE